MTQDVPMRVEGHILEEQPLDTQGHAVRVTVIRGGQSKNGFTYCESALQTIARLLEGAHAYADHARNDSDQQTRSVRDIIGFYHDARYIPPCPEAPLGRVDATLHILEGADWLWSIIQEACTLGRPELIGLSIDIFGQWNLNEASKAKEVISVAALNSCDVVTRPSAGGAFRRILHSVQSSSSQGDAHASSLLETQQGDIPPMTDTNSHLTETSSHALPTQSSPTQMSGEGIDEHNMSMQTNGNEQQFNTLLQQLQLERAQLALERRLLESVLPEPVKTTIRARYQGRIFEQNELEADLKAQQEMLAALSATGLIRGNSYEKPASGQMITEAEKIQAAFDRMFDLEIDTARLGAIRPFSSIREAYARVTGDSTVAGFSDRSTIGNIRVSENAPIARITEADTTTASFSYLLGTSMNKRLLKDYQAWPAEWMRFCSIVPIRDFKQQSRVRLGAFGSLPVVAEDSAYTAISL
ncbi:MAG: hypothetical protein JO031_04455, partial [Ktedonobacteraceae bacterium]|nr:hypothetical protein [Ktedonobacteraceae bacterium]